MSRARLLVVLVVVAIAGAAAAATSPLLFSAVIEDATLHVTTAAMPKGWFSTRNVLDRAKSDLVMTYELQATSCSDAGAGGTIHSTTSGNFTPALNPQGQTDGYYWDVVEDLASLQNHWHYHVGCDGERVVDGCDAARPVSVTVTAYDGNGACHTYVDDAGTTVCASDTRLVDLPAVQDPDVVVAECGGSCGIGPCESACTQACNDAFPNPHDSRDRQQCKDECECRCKLERPASCPPPVNCE